MHKLLLSLLWLPLVSPPDYDATVEKAVKYLLSEQQANGSWKGWGNEQQHPQAELAATALCGSALLAHPDVESARSKEAVKKALQYVTAFKLKGKWTVWGEPYSVLFLAQVYKQDKNDALLKTMGRYVSTIEANQFGASGAWGYWGAPKGSRDHAKTFNTALCLMALAAARDAGVKINEDGFSKGIEALKKFRGPDGLFNYHFWSKDKANAQQARFTYDPAEPVSRSVMAELALLQAKQGSQDSLNAMVQKFFEHRDNLERSYKKRDEKEAHLKPNGTAAYYYFFGHYYASQALAQSSDELRRKYAPVLREVMSKTQEPEGLWFDHRYLGGPYYCTALALMTLAAAKE